MGMKKATMHGRKKEREGREGRGRKGKEGRSRKEGRKEGRCFNGAQ